jgi:hypothetical protein
MFSAEQWTTHAHSLSFLGARLSSGLVMPVLTMFQYWALWVHLNSKHQFSLGGWLLNVFLLGNCRCLQSILCCFALQLAMMFPRSSPGIILSKKLSRLLQSRCCWQISKHVYLCNIMSCFWTHLMQSLWNPSLLLMFPYAEPWLLCR